MNVSKILPALAAALFTISTALTARAETVQQRAQRHAEAAQTAYELSDYARAIEEFKQAYSLDPDPRLFYNLGLAHLKKHELRAQHEDLVQSRDYFKRFLLLVDPTNPQYTADRARIEKMRSLAADYVRRLDEKERELAKPAPGDQPREPREPREPAEPPQLTATGPAPHEPSIVPPILYGIAATAGAGALVTGAIAVRSADSANERVIEGDLAGADERSSRARTFALVTDVLAGAAIATAVIGLVIDLGDDGENEVQAQLTPSGAAVFVRY